MMGYIGFDFDGGNWRGLYWLDFWLFFFVYY